MGGKITTPLGSLYHGTKFAVEGISEALNYELNPIGIKVRIIEPGNVRTDFAGRSMDFSEGSMPEEYNPMMDKFNKALDNIDDIKMSSPEEVAKVIYKAATATNNRMRYVIGNDAKLLIWIKKWLGTNIFMGFLRRSYKL
jgi:short-subunit dehydrogenase